MSAVGAPPAAGFSVFIRQHEFNHPHRDEMRIMEMSPMNVLNGFAASSVTESAANTIFEQRAPQTRRFIPVTSM